MQGNLSPAENCASANAAYLTDFGVAVTKVVSQKQDFPPLFRQTLSTLTGARIELFNTDGALGAARGAALGAGYYKTRGEAFAALRRLEVVEPAEADRETLEEGYRAWVREVEKRME